MLNKPHQYPFAEPSGFEQKLAAEGYEVEGCVRQLINGYEAHHQYDFQQQQAQQNNPSPSMEPVRTNCFSI